MASLMNFFVNIYYVICAWKLSYKYELYVNDIHLNAVFFDLADGAFELIGFARR